MTCFRPGDLVDIQLEPDDVYCPGIFHRMKGGMAMVKWIGWENFEDVPQDPATLLVPTGERVRFFKAWIMLDEKKSIPQWPCIVYIRTPFSDDGIEFLKTEKKVLVKLVAEKVAPLLAWTTSPDGIWFPTKYISPFRGSYTEERIAAGINHPKAKLALLFKTAIATISSPEFQIHGAPVVDYPFKFNGTLETGTCSSGLGATLGIFDIPEDDSSLGIGKRRGRKKKQGDASMNDMSYGIGGVGIGGIGGFGYSCSLQDLGPAFMHLPDDAFDAPTRSELVPFEMKEAYSIFDAALTVPTHARGSRPGIELAERYSTKNLQAHARLGDESFELARAFANQEPYLPLPGPLPRPIVRQVLKATPQGPQKGPVKPAIKVASKAPTKPVPETMTKLTTKSSSSCLTTMEKKLCRKPLLNEVKRRVTGQ